MVLKYRWLWLAGMLAVCCGLYWASLYGPFLFDDFPNLAALSSIQHVSSWRDLGIYLSQPRSFPGRPLAMLSFLLQKSDWPGHPFPFKLVNLIIHLVNGLLVYRLAGLVARAYKPGWEQSRVTLAALLTAAAWLLNPIQLSGVTLVVQRMTLLMAFFLLLGLLAYLHGLLNEAMTPRRRGLWMAVGVWFCMGLSFLCKENGILLPLFALVLDATVLRPYASRLPRGLAWWRRLLIWPIVAFVIIYLIRAGIVQWGYHGIRDYTEGQRLLTEPRILWDYITRIFVPHYGVYGLYHDGYTVSRTLFSPWNTLPALLSVIGMGIAGLVLRKRWPLLALAVLWYLGGQLIESSTVMLELYFEHRNYTPSIGLFLAAALAIVAIGHDGRRKLALVLSGIWLIACCITTGLSAQVYRSADRLAQAWAAQQPESIRAQSMLANRLLQHGQLAASTRVIEKAQRSHPRDTGLASMHLFLDCSDGKATAAEVRQTEQLFSTVSFSRAGFSNMKQLRLVAQSGHCPALTVERWKHLVTTMLANPAYGHNGIAAGFLHYQWSKLAVAEGHLDTAVTQLQATYRNDPNANIPRLEAKYLASAGLYQQAIHTLQTTDYSRLPRLRRLLVNDRAINREDIAILRKREANAVSPKGRPKGDAPQRGRAPKGTAPKGTEVINCAPKGTEVINCT